MTSYNLPLPPRADDESSLLALMADHDQLALQEVPTQLDLLGGITVEGARELLQNLDLVRAQHEARARNIESTVTTIQQKLHMNANVLDEGRTVVGTATHTSQLDPVAVQGASPRR